MSALCHTRHLTCGLRGILRPLLKNTNILTALCIGLATLLGYAAPSSAQQNLVTAIDIALEPDQTMIQHAKAANARLRKAYPQGFTLDATHQPHITMLQQFVRTADLDKVYAAAAKVLANEKPTSWKLKAFKYYYIPDPPIGIAGIVIEPTEDLTRLQQELLDAIAPFTVKTGTAAAFMTTEEGRDIQKGLIDYVTNFVSIGAGKKFNPHVTTGVGTIVYLDKMLANRSRRSRFRLHQHRSINLALLVRPKELKALLLQP